METPLTPLEFMIGQVIVGLLRTIVAAGFMVVLALTLYHYNLFSMGLPLVAFFCNLLVMGWAIGLLVSALILRFGQGAESLAWAVIFLASDRANFITGETLYVSGGPRVSNRED